MSTDTVVEESLSAPYVGFPTFKNFIKMLADVGIPTTIDKSVMSNLSGGNQSHLIKTLKFLGLTDQDGVPTDELNSLVESVETPNWPEVLGGIVQGSYSDIVSEIDVSKASSNDLDKCFERLGFRASSLDKVVRFYVACLKDSGCQVSSFIEKRKARATRKRTPNGNTNGNAKAKSNPNPEQSEPDKETPDEMMDYPVYFSNGRKGLIRVPADVSIQDCNMITLTVPLIEAYAERNQ